MLDAAGDATAARTAEAAFGSRDETEGHAQAPAPGVGEGEDGGADRGLGRSVRPLDGSGVLCVDLEDGHVTLAVDGDGLSGGGAAVGERHLDLLAPQVVGVGEHLARRQHDARPGRPASGHADHTGPGGLRDAGYGLLKLLNGCHRASSAANL